MNAIDLSPPARIMTGISGGVDSSVTALLLKEQGYEVHALFMKNWEEDDSAGHCSAAEDLRDAQAVCERLDIPLHTVNFATEYWDNVFARCLAEYSAGRTPNPDVLCNREIKFKTFLDHALHLGAAAMATGHYARIRAGDDGLQLCKGRDPGKDQSYFLYMLGQKQLSHALFPVGDLEKSAVRTLAERAGLVTHAKKDSTGICFIGERHFKTFLQRFLPVQPGPIETPEGRQVGEHQGLMYYTLGQRQGLGIGGRADSNGDPWFVAEKDLAHNRLVVVQGGDHPLLFTRRLLAGELHWVAGHPPPLPLRCMAKTRYRQPDQVCTLTAIRDGCGEILFEYPQRAVTPGQSVVCYADDVCLGGGIIEETSGGTETLL